jgi:hypothetical protein
VPTCRCDHVGLVHERNIRRSHRPRLGDRGLSPEQSAGPRYDPGRAASCIQCRPRVGNRSAAFWGRHSPPRRFRAVIRGMNSGRISAASPRDPRFPPRPNSPRKPRQAASQHDFRSPVSLFVPVKSRTEPAVNSAMRHHFLWCPKSRLSRLHWDCLDRKR